MAQGRENTADIPVAILYMAREIWIRSEALASMGSSSADLTRNLLQLPTAPEQFQALQQKLRRARMAGVGSIIVPVSWRHVAPFMPEQVEEAKMWRPYQQLFSLIGGGAADHSRLVAGRSRHE